MTFNDLEGQNNLAYDASGSTMSMQVKNQVNRYSGLAMIGTRTENLVAMATGPTASRSFRVGNVRWCPGVTFLTLSNL